MKSGFIVTKDFATSDNCLSGETISENMPFDSIEVIGPRNCKLNKEELLKGNIFQMFDDDDNLYYEGFFVGDKYSEEAFMPLDCFGLAHAGCTYIKYKNDKDEWFIL